MIKKLKISAPERTPVAWWHQVDALKGIAEFEFKPNGVTILWGPNGVGKSTVLRLLARLAHCEQGGVPKVTSQSVGHFQNGFGRDVSVNDGASILGDGKPTYFVDPSATVGLENGAFDPDFHLEGVRAAMTLNQLSSGQTTNFNSGRVLKEAAEGTEIDRSYLDRIKEHIDPAIAKAASQAFMATSRSKEGRRTLLLDEPGRSLDIPTQIRLWQTLTAQTHYQIIVATHSLFALFLKGVKYIDLKPGYLDECRRKVTTNFDL